MRDMATQTPVIVDEELLSRVNFSEATFLTVRVHIDASIICALCSDDHAWL
jgi:hypothetical protein